MTTCLVQKHGSIGAEVSAAVDDDLFGADDGSIGSEVSAAVDDDLCGADDGSVGVHNGCSVASDGAKSSSE